jgi:hypothetical protein
VLGFRARQVSADRCLDARREAKPGLWSGSSRQWNGVGRRIDQFRIVIAEQERGAPAPTIAPPFQLGSVRLTVADFRILGRMQQSDGDEESAPRRPERKAGPGSIGTAALTPRTVGRGPCFAKQMRVRSP